MAKSVHVPPFKQGEDAHTSSTVVQSMPVYPGLQIIGVVVDVEVVVVEEEVVVDDDVSCTVQLVPVYGNTHRQVNVLTGNVICRHVVQ